MTAIVHSPTPATKDSKGEVRRFVRQAIGFSVGLAAVVSMAETALAIRNTRSDGQFLIGREVHLAKKLAASRNLDAHMLFLGDSVARQLYPTGTAEDGWQSLTSNQAISIEGQYFLLRDALASHPHVSDVTLLYSPLSWRNDLDQVFTGDYFCGYFHTPEQIVETFKATHRWELAVQCGSRAVLPHLAAMNSWLNQSTEAVAGPPLPGGLQPVPVSRVSTAFLARIRALCLEHHVRIHVFPAPVSDHFHFRDDSHVYDRPILYLSQAIFLSDTVHLRPDRVAFARGALEHHLSTPDSAEEEEGRLARRR